MALIIKPNNKLALSVSERYPTVRTVNLLKRSIRWLQQLLGHGQKQKDLRCQHMQRFILCRFSNEIRCAHLRMLAFSVRD